MSKEKSGEAPAPKPKAPPQRPPLSVCTNAEEKVTNNSTVAINTRKKL